MSPTVEEMRKALQTLIVKLTLEAYEGDEADFIEQALLSGLPSLRKMTINELIRELADIAHTEDAAQMGEFLAGMVKQEVVEAIVDRLKNQEG